MTLKSSDIEALVELFDKSDWDELEVEIGGEQILLSKNAQRTQMVVATVPQAVPQVAQASAVQAGGNLVATAAPPSASSPVASVRGANWVAIKAANLGTYYRAPSPDAKPYVAVGTSVTDESEVCMIEVMKLFTTIRAGLSGTVREICVDDGQMVEYGQELMWIEPV